jgi:hypothetical protein
MRPHDGRHEDDDRRIDKAGSGPEPAVRPLREKRTDGQKSKSAGDGGPETGVGEEEDGEGGKAEAEHDLHRAAGLHPRHVGPFGHHGDPGGEPEQGEQPAALIGRQQGHGDHDDAGHDPGAQLLRGPPLGGGRQGGPFIRHHGHPARALRPPKRRSRRPYSSMAALKVASSKSGQKSGRKTNSE